MLVLRAAKGLHGDCWTDQSAFMSIQCSQPVQLWLSLPDSLMLKESKDVYLSQDGDTIHLSVPRGQAAAPCVLNPKDGHVSVTIDCSYPDVEGPPKSRKLGTQISFISLIGEEPIGFGEFLQKSVAKTKSVTVSNAQGRLMRLNMSSKVDVRIEEIRDGKVPIVTTGWSGTAARGRLFVDGIATADIEMHQSKQKPGQVLPVHEGTWEIPKKLQDGQPHVYSFELTDGETVARSDVVLRSYPQFGIEVEHADAKSVRGWAIRRDGSEPLGLEIYSDGEFQSSVEAFNSRFDVKSQFNLKSDEVGFAVVLEKAKGGASRIVTLRDVETRIFLAEVSISNRYDSLVETITSLRSGFEGVNTKQLVSVLAPLAMTSKHETIVSVRKLPKLMEAEEVDGVDVVIPIYGGSIETAECLESVLEASNITRSRVILVNDCSPDPLINDLLDALEMRRLKNVIIIRRKKNMGFSEAVNLGMIIAGDRHVVLLNADTVVQNGWIDRLMAAAKSDPMIGTVTPFSNNGEIVTLPYACRSLAVEDALLARQVDELAFECNAGKTIDIPVAIGFCMFIRRECINEVGLFDAAMWGRGYGEEVDFCLKARAKGWRHVVATDTFVVHRGNVSFGDEKFKRIIESAQKISELYPFYDQLIQRYIAEDPIRANRRTLNLALISRALAEDRVLHVYHSFGGGTEKYVRDTAAIQVKQGQAPLFLRFDSDGKAQLEANLEGTNLHGLFDERHTEIFTTEELSALKSDIKSLNISRVHIHATFGMSIDFVEWLSSSFPLTVTIHDYAWICPRVTLAQHSGRYCGEPAVEKCDSCIALYSAHPGLRKAFDDSEGSVAVYRRNMSRILRRAEVVLAGAADVEKRLRSHGIEAAYRVMPHPEPEAATTSNVPVKPRKYDGRVRVALFGAISEGKGFHKLIACAKFAHDNMLPLTFIVFGYTVNDEVASKLPNITLTGYYNEEDLAELVQQYRPDISFFPNQWPETYSYTLSHSFRFKLWPIVTDLGAPAERVVAESFGEIVAHDANEATLCDRLMAAGHRQLLEKLRSLNASKFSSKR